MSRKIRNSFFYLGLIIFLIIAVGTTFFKFFENIGWIESLYSTILLLVTAGTGNIHPTSVASQLFTIAFVLLGVPVVLFCLGYVIEELFKMRFKAIDNKMNEVIEEENKILKEETKILSKEAELLKNELKKKP